MAYDYEKQERTTVDTSIDLGLKAYMNKVYSFMAVGLGLTGVIAHLVSTLAFDSQSNSLTAFGTAIYASPLAFIIMLAPLGFMIALSIGIHKMRESTVQILFWTFAATMGLSLSSIFIHNFRRIWSFKFIWIHNKKGSVWMGFFFIHGINRHINCLNC